MMEHLAKILLLLLAMLLAMGAAYAVGYWCGTFLTWLKGKVRR